jgi:DNA polymerase (family 10)
MERAAMTARVVRALHAPATMFLAHPSGRLLLEREASALDWEPVFEAARARGVCLEFNTSPARLDLDWRLIRAATERGIRIVVNPDAHRLDMLESVAPALATARKGWLTREQVFNTASVEEIEEAFLARRTRGRSGP